eukprot:INCI13477.27.p1 GENE.INCI13477.27~~INCI13477.27.p1  ORF type:complete len:217 (+),score=31.07 INCI13477.27:84-734(+)
MNRLIVPTLASAAALGSSSCFARAAGTPACTFDGGCSWDALPFKCTHPALVVDYTNVVHYSGAVECGNLFLEKDIGGGSINVAPIVVLPDAEAGSYYTILMVDPDADVNGSFPEIDAPGQHAPVRHWIQANVLGSDLAIGTLGEGSDEVAAFRGPSPPAGSHRYGQFVFRQAAKQEFVPFNSSAPPINFDYGAWLKENNLTDLVASNWHITQHTDP